MKVLHLLNTGRFSGAENMVCQIISAFRSQPDVEMAYCSLDGPIRQALEDRDISFLPLEAMTSAALKKVLKEYQPDVIHAHDMKASFTAAKAAGRIPVVAHIHNNNMDSRGLSPKSLAFLSVSWKFKHIFWVSKGAMEGYRFRNALKKKSEVLYNIIDPEAIRRQAEQCEDCRAYDVVYLGRLAGLKDPLRLMSVFQRVLKQVPGARLGVIGTGELLDATQERAKELGIEKNVEFLGFVSGPAGLLSRAKLMAMTSKTEGTPMCALEALALGVPVVSTPVGGMCELIEDGKNGYLSEDDETLARHMVQIITDEDLRQRLSHEATKRANAHNDLAVYRSKILRAYECCKS